MNKVDTYFGTFSPPFSCCRIPSALSFFPIVIDLFLNGDRSSLRSSFFVGCCPIQRISNWHTYASVLEIIWFLNHMLVSSLKIIHFFLLENRGCYPINAKQSNSYSIKTKEIPCNALFEFPLQDINTKITHTQTLTLSHKNIIYKLIRAHSWTDLNMAYK